MKKIYLDNAATTKPNLDAFNRSQAFAIENFYNPSATYRDGRAVLNEINLAKSRILKYFPNSKLIFTSCGTESDNTAISLFKRKNAVSTQGEHSAVFQTLENLRSKGQTVRYAKLNPDGSVNIDDFLSLIDKDTTFCSVVHVNNETGAINDINYLAKRAKEISPNLIFHSDGVQAFGKISSGYGSFVDLYSVSAHKIGGLKGVGCLIYNEKLKFSPFIFGGGQEGGLRSGTENVLGIINLSYCAENAYENLAKNLEKTQNLKNEFLSRINKELITVISSDNASPYVISISAKGLRGEVLQHMLEDEGIIVGTGSACSSKHPHSRVIKACNYKNDILDGVLRISFSFETEIDDVLICAEKLNLCVEKLDKVMNKR